MELNPSEIHFIKRTLEARQEWIKDNPDDDSIEEDEKECIESILNKLPEVKWILKVD
jgi:hypothetical protein